MHTQSGASFRRPLNNLACFSSLSRDYGRCRCCHHTTVHSVMPMLAGRATLLAASGPEWKSSHFPCLASLGLGSGDAALRFISLHFTHLAFFFSCVRACALVRLVVLPRPSLVPMCDSTVQVNRRTRCWWSTAAPFPPPTDRPEQCQAKADAAARVSHSIGRQAGTIAT